MSVPSYLLLDACPESENADRIKYTKQRCRVAEIVECERLIPQARAIWTGRLLIRCQLFSSLVAAHEELTHESRVMQGAWQVVPSVSRLTSKWCAMARAPMG